MRFWTVRASALLKETLPKLDLILLFPSRVVAFDIIWFFVSMLKKLLTEEYDIVSCSSHNLYTLYPVYRIKSKHILILSTLLFALYTRNIWLSCCCCTCHRVEYIQCIFDVISSAEVSAMQGVITPYWWQCRLQTTVWNVWYTLVLETEGPLCFVPGKKTCSAWQLYDDCLQLLC